MLTKSSLETKAFGRRIAQEILNLPEPRQSAFVIGLKGDLGGGKTTFVQGFAKGLGIKEKILSPTFVILRKFKIQNSKFKILFHIDCYRLKNSRELLDLGFKEIVSNPKNIVVVEWADKIRKILPENTILLRFDFVDEKTRKIMLK